MTPSTAVVRTTLKLLAGLLVAFIVCWGVTNAFVHSEAVAGTKVVVRTQIGDSGRSVPVARRAAGEADRWLCDVFGQPITEETSIRLARSGNCQWVENLLGLERSTAWSGSGGICVYTGRRIWKRLLASDGARNAEEVVIHELIHEAQRELGCVDEPDHQRFRWLMEGTAVYQLWHRGVRRLADEHGGVAALRGFCAEVGKGRDWRAAFADAFGLSSAAFYAEFERARR